MVIVIESVSSRIWQRVVDTKQESLDSIEDVATYTRISSIKVYFDIIYFFSYVTHMQLGVCAKLFLLEETSTSHVFSYLFC